MGRIRRLAWCGFLAATLAAVLAPASVHAQSSGKTLNFIPEADLKSLEVEVDVNETNDPGSIFPRRG